jgi:hypothetical protein
MHSSLIYQNHWSKCSEARDVHWNRDLISAQNAWGRFSSVSFEYFPKAKPVLIWSI